MKYNFFTRPSRTDIDKVLRKRVNTYFKKAQIAKTGNAALYWKTAIFIVSFVAMISILYLLNPPWYWYLLVTIVLGVINAGIGMNVMHDANHGVFSSKAWVNNFFGASIYLLAGNVHNWKAQHNRLHHSFTNIHDHDEDLDAGKFIRFSQHSPYRPWHVLQRYWIYPGFLYSLLTLNWAITTDFMQTYRYMKDSRVSDLYHTGLIPWMIVVISKILLFSFWIALPIVLGIAVWKVLVGYLVMHMVTGFILSNIFQLAHINKEIEVVENRENMKPRTNAEHQLRTTANFAVHNKFMRWYTGGLTHQIEHHLFPNISHVHYAKISHIVRGVAREFNIEYVVTHSFRQAIKDHYRWIAGLGYRETSIQTN